MIEVRQTEEFLRWLRGLRDRSARSRIAQRLVRIASGLLGDGKPVGDGVSELRVDTGPGYRLYFVRENEAIIVLLCGGDKDGQDRDIVRAKLLARQLKER